MPPAVRSPASTSRPPCHNTKVTPPNAVNVSTPKKSARDRARCRAPSPRADPRPVALAFVNFLRKALHHADLAERFLGDRGGVGHLVLHADGDSPEPAPEVEDRAMRSRSAPRPAW